MAGGTLPAMPLLAPEPFAVRWRRTSEAPVAWFFDASSWWPAEGYVDQGDGLTPILSGEDPQHLWLRGNPADAESVEVAVDLSLGAGPDGSSWVPPLQTVGVLDHGEAGLVRACRLRDELLRAAAA